MAWPLIRQPVRIRNCWQLLLVPLFTRPAAPRPAIPASTSPSKPGRPRMYGGVRRTACAAAMQCGPPSRFTYYNAISGKGKVAGKRLWRLRALRPDRNRGYTGFCPRWQGMRGVRSTTYNARAGMVLPGPGGHAFPDDGWERANAAWTSPGPGSVLLHHACIRHVGRKGGRAPHGHISRGCAVGQPAGPDG